MASQCGGMRRAERLEKLRMVLMDAQYFLLCSKQYRSAMPVKYTLRRHFSCLGCNHRGLWLWLYLDVFFGPWYLFQGGRHHVLHRIWIWNLPGICCCRFSSFEELGWYWHVWLHFHEGKLYGLGVLWGMLTDIAQTFPLLQQLREDQGVPVHQFTKPMSASLRHISRSV